ncbi:MAG: Glyoxalase/bleomycin resistance protein/dioxygenase [Betaproteobacteria bacterium]|nr:Glyoxalase/bleomycin resistance protein/dioxygenase [Betaproteobacteria bacterium]
MAIHGMNHFTILTDNMEGTRDFYCKMLDLEVGKRPNFSFPGWWLYKDGVPILHVVGGRPRAELRAGTLDHMAFTATGLLPTLQRLEEHKIGYELRRLDAPEGGVDLWQLFFMDPNNAKVELDFAGKEPGPANFKDQGTAAATVQMKMEDQ